MRSERNSSADVMDARRTTGMSQRTKRAHMNMNMCVSRRPKKYCARPVGIVSSREARCGMAEYISEAEVLQRALDTYGSALQIVVMMEEMSELQKELCKYLRGKYSPANIAEEIADVEIMLEQMKMLFCCADDVHDVRRRKVERLKERLDNGI